MPSLCWKFNLKIDVDETQRNATTMGFNAIFLEGQSRTHHQVYPLNQIKISGGTLSPNVKVHVGPNVTEIFYYGSNFNEVEEIEKALADLDGTEKTLNIVAKFGPDEINRFNKNTENRVPSINMLNVQIYLKDKLQKAMDSIQQAAIEETKKALVDFGEGRMREASVRLESLINELLQFLLGLISLAKESNDPRAEEWEANLRKALSSMNGSS